MACSNRETIKLAARLGMGALTFAFVDPDEAGHWVEDYYRILSEECVPIGHTVNANIAMVVGLSMHADRDEAERRGLEGFHFFGHGLLHYYVIGQHKRAGPTCGTTFRNPGSRLRAGGDAGIGTPDQVTRQLKGYADVGVDQVMFIQQSGRNRHDHICQSLEMFAKEVMPALKEGEDQREAAKAARLAPHIEAALARRTPMAPLDDDEIRWSTRWGLPDLRLSLGCEIGGEDPAGHGVGAYLDPGAAGGGLHHLAGEGDGGIQGGGAQHLVGSAGPARTLRAEGTSNTFHWVSGDSGGRSPVRLQPWRARAGALRWRWGWAREWNRFLPPPTQWSPSRVPTWTRCRPEKGRRRPARPRQAEDDGPYAHRASGPASRGTALGPGGEALSGVFGGPSHYPHGLAEAHCLHPRHGTGAGGHFFGGPHGQRRRGCQSLGQGLGFFHQLVVGYHSPYQSHLRARSALTRSPVSSNSMASAHSTRRGNRMAPRWWARRGALRGSRRWPGRWR